MTKKPNLLAEIIETVFSDVEEYEVARERFMALYQASLERLTSFWPDEDLPSHITADIVQLACVDTKSGLFISRDLPLTYEENHLALRLIGEDLSGGTSEIVFLSQRSQEKLPDVLGQGPDHDTCGHH